MSSAKAAPGRGSAADATASPRSSPEAEALLARWRERAATMLLWVEGLLGLPLVLVFVEPLLEARSYGTLAFSVFLIASDLFLAARRTLSTLFRASWAVFNLAAAGVPELFLGGDRGASAALVLAAIMLGVLLVGARAAVAIVAVYTALVALTAWGYAHGALPMGEFVPIDWNTPEGWLGLWSVVVFVAVLVILASEQMFRSLRLSMAEQATAATAREDALHELVREREERIALRERADAAERALAETLVAVGAGVWEASLIDNDARWSDGMYALMGYAPGEVTPSMATWSARIHPDDLARILSLPPQEMPAFEYRVVLPSGATRVLRAQMQTLVDDSGRPVRVRGIATDITAEKQTARQLARLAEVASRTGNAVVVTDVEGRIEWVNDAFTRLTGWSLDEVAGRIPGSLLQGPHSDPTVRVTMRDAIARRADFDVEVLNYARDGRQYWVQIETRVSRDERGVPNGFVAVETDITERRIANSRDALARRVAAVLLSSDAVPGAADAVMRELVRELDVLVAQVWLVEPGRPHLTWLAGATAANTGEHGQTFLDATRGLDFAEGTERHVGVGLPGVAWGTRAPVTLTKFRDAGTDGHTSRRLEAALAAGVQTFTATPILGPEGVLGVIEIGGTPFYPGHEQLPAVLERVAEQLASFMMHDVSRRAFETIFARSPDALLLVDAFGAVLGSNARAHLLFGETSLSTSIDALIDGGVGVVRDALTTTKHSPSSPLLNLAARGTEGPFSAEVSVSATPSSAKQIAILSVRDLTERHRMEQALTRSLREKDTLLREVHHRVKNNLQIVSSLLSLQADSVEPGPSRSALAETVLRVRSMAFVHQQLYGTDHVDGVDLGAYARTLSTSLQGTLDPAARLSFAVETVEVSVDVAVPCGLVLNELLTNAFKHGRGPDGRCVVEVVVARSETGLRLGVRDHGPGMPDGGLRAGSLGVQLLRSLSRQLRGRLETTNDGGAHITLHVPLAPATASTTAAPTTAATTPTTTPTAAG